MRSPRTDRRHRPSTRSRTRRPLVAAAVAGALVLAACGGDDDATTTTEDTVVTDVELEPIEDVPADEAGPADKPVVDLPDELPTELVVTDLVDGEGREAVEGDTVIVDYVGVRSEDGVEFDSSWDRGVPFDVRLGSGSVIRGWEIGLEGVQVGGRRQLDIPADLAYGDAGAGEIIRPGDAITFVVDVRAVIPALGPDDAPDELDLETSTGATDLTVDVVAEGDGAVLEEGDIVIAHARLYRGDDLTLLFDTWEVGDPVQILLQDDGILTGLIDGMVGARIGDLLVLTMPPELAWGDDGNPGLDFPGDVDLVAVMQILGAY